VVPIILILSSALAKKLVRGTSWSRVDFFLGVELSLAAMAAGLINFFDLSKSLTQVASAAASGNIASNGVFLAICFFLLLWVLATHQDWEKRAQDVAGQVLWLGIVCNLVGAGLMISFILLVKGIK
jgi:hypothetical protein